MGEFDIQDTRNAAASGCMLCSIIWAAVRPMLPDECIESLLMDFRSGNSGLEISGNLPNLHLETVILSSGGQHFGRFSDRRTQNNNLVEANA